MATIYKALAGLLTAFLAALLVHLNMTNADLIEAVTRSAIEAVVVFLGVYIAPKNQPE